MGGDGDEALRLMMHEAPVVGAAAVAVDAAAERGGKLIQGEVLIAVRISVVNERAGVERCAAIVIHGRALAKVSLTR